MSKWSIKVFNNKGMLDDANIIKSIQVEYDPGDNLDGCILLDKNDVGKFPDFDFDFEKYDYFLENEDYL